MFVPSNITESDLLDLIQKISKRFWRKFSFGYMTEEDIYQECVIMVIKSECLRKYDPALPLENFLTIHLRNRLYNFKRDNFAKPNRQCLRCSLDEDERSRRPPGNEKACDCPAYNKWYASNVDRKNIMNTTSIDNIIDENEYNMRYDTDFGQDLDDQDRRDHLLENLSVDARKVYLMLMDGHKLRKAELDLLTKEVEDLLGEN